MRRCMVGYPFRVQVAENLVVRCLGEKGMVIPENSNKMLPVGVKKALDCSRIYSVTRVQGDLDFLFSRWSMGSHMFVVA